MKDVILNLEEDFANNEYFSTNVWTEEKYRVLSGNFPVLLSAPHSVNQIRGVDVRDAEKYTGAIVRYLSRTTNSYGVFEIFTHADPNYDTNHNYKNAIINLIETYNIKLLLDIHSSTFKDVKGHLNKVEVSEEVYRVFDKFEPQDIKELNEYDRHIEHSEIF